MAIGNEKQGKFFKPTNIFRLKNLNMTERKKEVWNLSYGSFMKVVYKFEFIKKEEIINEININTQNIKRRFSKSVNNSYVLGNNLSMSTSFSGNEETGKDEKFEFFEPKKTIENVVFPKTDKDKIKKNNASAFVLNTEKDDDILDKSDIITNLSMVSEHKEGGRIKSIVGFFESVNHKRNSNEKLNRLQPRDSALTTTPKQSLLDNSDFRTVSHASTIERASILSDTIRNAEEKKTQDLRREDTMAESDRISILMPNSKKISKKFDPEFTKTVNILVDKNEISAEIDSEKSASKLTILNPVECEIPDKEKHIADSFCDGFFLAGLTPLKASVVECSEEYNSSCGHQDCSLLPSYKPEILSRYPVKDSKLLELTNLTASLCFPTGIKLCYATDESKIKTVKNYYTQIVNQDGVRYYMMTYHYFVKIDNSTFHETYDINPLKEFMKFEQIAENYKNNPALKEKYEMKLEKQLEVCTSFNFNDYIYLPFCVCLISKFPFAKQMEIALQTILNIAFDESKTNVDVNQLIMHLIREIPIPINDKRLNMFLPGNNYKIEITSPIYLDLPVSNSSVNILLRLFSVENIVTIINLILMEQKLLFVHNDYFELSQIIDCFVSLLHPLV